MKWNDALEAVKKIQNQPDWKDTSFFSCSPQEAERTLKLFEELVEIHNMTCEENGGKSPAGYILGYYYHEFIRDLRFERLCNKLGPNPSLRSFLLGFISGTESYNRRQNQLKEDESRKLLYWIADRLECILLTKSKFNFI